MQSPPAAADARERTDLYCTECSKKFIAQLDLGLDGNHIIECPHCGHEHCRVVAAGKVTDVRWSTRAQRIDVDKRCVWKSDSLPIKTSTAAAFIRAAWLDKLDGVDIDLEKMGEGGDVNISPTATVSNTTNITFQMPYTILTGSTTICNAWTQWNNFTPANITVGPTGPTITPNFAPNPNPPKIMAPMTFNKYVNASDLLEEFIAFLHAEGVRKSEIMGLPIEHFIKWLIIRACEVDQEEPGVVLALPAPKPKPRCLGCGRWMKQTATLLLHGDRCAQWHFARVAA